MKAFVLTETGPRIQETAAPTARAGEVVVRVRAAGLNRADLAMAMGHKHGFHGGIGQVLGSDWAGEVVSAGEGVSDLEPGRRVMGSAFGAFAEFVACPALQVFPMPELLGFEQAAGLGVALVTMHDALVTQGGLRPGQSVFIHGASTGVGLVGLQIAKALGAGLVIGSSTSEEKRGRLAELGAGVTVDTSGSDWSSAVLTATADQGADLTVDMVAGRLVNETLKCTRIGGRVINVGRMGGRRGELDFDLHALRRIALIGVTFRTRTPGEVAEAFRAARRDLAASLAEGRIQVPVDSVFALEEAPEALERMKSNQHFGRLILKV